MCLRVVMCGVHFYRNRIQPQPARRSPPHSTNSSGARLDLADARFHEARDLVLDLGMVPQPALELVRDGARAHLRSDG